MKFSKCLILSAPNSGKAPSSGKNPASQIFHYSESILYLKIGVTHFQIHARINKMPRVFKRLEFVQIFLVLPSFFTLADCFVARKQEIEPYNFKEGYQVTTTARKIKVHCDMKYAH